jgi:hypothetical protein
MEFSGIIHQRKGELQYEKIEVCSAGQRPVHGTSEGYPNDQTPWAFLYGAPTLRRLNAGYYNTILPVRFFSAFTFL